MSNIEHKRGRYSRFEDGLIITCVSQHGTAEGLDKAALKLNRRRAGIEKHYYKNIAANKYGWPSTPVPPVSKEKKTAEVNKSQTTLFPKADKVDVAVPREVKSVQLNVAGIELYLTFK